MAFPEGSGNHPALPPGAGGRHAAAQPCCAFLDFRLGVELFPHQAGGGADGGQRFRRDMGGSGDAAQETELLAVYAVDPFGDVVTHQASLGDARAFTAGGGVHAGVLLGHERAEIHGHVDHAAVNELEVDVLDFRETVFKGPAQLGNGPADALMRRGEVRGVAIFQAVSLITIGNSFS